MIRGIERRYELNRQGYDLDRIATRVGEILGKGTDEVFSKGRQQRNGKAKSLPCLWAVSGISMSLDFPFFNAVPTIHSSAMKRPKVTGDGQTAPHGLYLSVTHEC
jgi:hypothetical protein